MPEIDGGVLGSLDALAIRAVSSAARPVVLIDGRSGSGKTTLGRALAARLQGAQLVSLDDVYPGWGGLEAASQTVVDGILRPVAPGYRRWDWGASVPTTWRSLSADQPLVIEGAGALTASSSRLATLTVWVELDAATRKRRALARDGAGYEPWWDMWAVQEDAHIIRDSPRKLADAVVRG